MKRHPSRLTISRNLVTFLPTGMSQRRSLPRIWESFVNLNQIVIVTEVIEIIG
jgi:hypothetical protein